MKNLILFFSFILIITSVSCMRAVDFYDPIFSEHSASYHKEVYSGMRSHAEQDSLSAIAQKDTVKWNEFIRLTNLPGEGGDASCDSIWNVVFGYSLEWK